MTAAASARAAPPPCMSMGRRPGRDGSSWTHFTLFTFDETTDVGADTGAPVTDDYPARDNGFTGTVKWVQLDLGDDDHSHLIPPEHHLRVAMTRQ